MLSASKHGKVWRGGVRRAENDRKAPHVQVQTRTGPGLDRIRRCGGPAQREPKRRGLQRVALSQRRRGRAAGQPGPGAQNGQAVLRHRSGAFCDPGD